VRDAYGIWLKAYFRRVMAIALCLLAAVGLGASFAASSSTFRSSQEDDLTQGRRIPEVVYLVDNPDMEQSYCGVQVGPCIALATIYDGYRPVIVIVGQPIYGSVPVIADQPSGR
jgi:hypothetical protein